MNLRLESPERRLVALLLGVGILRLLFIATSGLELTTDEAYYWHWSRFPDWCYYSKPPLVAWIIGLSTAVAGDNELGVRLPSVLLGSGTLAILFFITRTLYSARGGLLAVLLVLATPANAAMNLIMTIDAPLAFFWALTLWCVAETTFGKPDSRVPWWPVAGVAAGFALLSKQMGMFLPVLALLSATALRKPPRTLGGGLGWVFLGVLLASIPVLFWNAANDWIMFAHTSHHIESRPWSPADILNTLPEYLLVQFLLVNPVLFGAYAFLTWKGIRNWKLLGDRERFLFIWGFIPLLIFLALALKQRVLPNWPLVFYLPVFVMIAGWLDRRTLFPSIRSLDSRRLRRRAIAIGLVLVLAFYALPYVLASVGQRGLLHRAEGYESLAQSVQRIRSGHDERLQHLPIVVIGHRSLVDALAFYLPEQPHVHRYSLSGSIESQHELWPNPPAGSRVLLAISADVHPLPMPPNRLTNGFTGLRFVGIAEASGQNRRPRTLRLFTAVTK